MKHLDFVGLFFHNFFPKLVEFFVYYLHCRDISVPASGCVGVLFRKSISVADDFVKEFSYKSAIFFKFFYIGPVGKALALFVDGFFHFFQARSI